MTSYLPMRASSSVRRAFFRGALSERWASHRGQAGMSDELFAMFQSLSPPGSLSRTLEALPPTRGIPYPGARRRCTTTSWAVNTFFRPFGGRPRGPFVYEKPFMGRHFWHGPFKACYSRRLSTMSGDPPGGGSPTVPERIVSENKTKCKGAGHFGRAKERS